MRNTNDMAHTLGLSVVFQMMEQAAHENSGFMLFNVQIHEAVLQMAKTWFVKINVKREEGRVTKT